MLAARGASSHASPKMAEKPNNTHNNDPTEYVITTEQDAQVFDRDEAIRQMATGVGDMAKIAKIV